MAHALIIIDMQYYFLDKSGHAFMPKARAIITPVLELSHYFYESNWPIITTTHAHPPNDHSSQMAIWWKKRLPRINDLQSELIPEIKNITPNLHIIKSNYSAFSNTPLFDYLSKLQITTITLCGITTNLCIETTARHAFALNIQPIIISNACAAKTLNFHNASLLNMAYGFGPVMTSSDYINKTFISPTTNG